MRLFGAILTFLFLLAFLFATPAWAEETNGDNTTQDTSAIQRIAGKDATETSAKIGLQAFPNGAKCAVVARFDDSMDAMSATGLAGALDAPILLTETTQLSTATKDAIEKLGVENVYIIGGSKAISKDVETSLKDAVGASGSVKRIAGHEYYDTSVKCAEEIKTVLGDEAPSDVIVASGYSFQDALSISSLAYANKLPIFLTTRGDTSDVRGLTDGYDTEDNLSAADYIESILTDESTIYVPGGRGAVSDVCVAFSKGTKLRLSEGKDAYDTSNYIAKYLVEKGILNSGSAVVACGAEAPKGVDALAGAALAGKNKTPILLVNSKNYNDGNTANNTNDVTIAGSGSYLQINATANVYILGGTGVLPTGSNAGIDLEKEIESNLVEGISVSFVTYEGDKNAPATQKIIEGGKATRPADPTREGYVFDGWYTDAACTKQFDFTTPITTSITLYAKWVQVELDGFFMASTSLMENISSATNKISNPTLREAALEKEVKAAHDANPSTTVYISGAQLKADVATMKEELKNSTTTDTFVPDQTTQPVSYKYYQYMVNEWDSANGKVSDSAIHLYTTYGSVADDWADYTNTDGTADAVATNKYAEFRIINVGPHQYDAYGNTDGSTLTFHATHFLPTAYRMSPYSVGWDGWANYDLYSKMQQSGEIYSKFNSTFTSAIKQVTKSYRADANYSITNTSTDALWLLSYSEIASGCSDTYSEHAPGSKINSEEGKRYQYFGSVSTNGSSCNTHLQYKTRAGASASGAVDGVTRWWLRSRFSNNVGLSYLTFLGVDSDGNPGGSWVGGNLLGVAPAFSM